MLRRVFIRNSGLAASAVFFAPFSVRGEDEPLCTEPKKLTVTIDVARNHGHGFSLTPAEVIEYLRKTAAENIQVDFNIQGTSGHEHLISVGKDFFLALLTEGAVVISSSIGAGHAHDVKVTLNVETCQSL